MKKSNVKILATYKNMQLRYDPSQIACFFVVDLKTNQIWHQSDFLYRKMTVYFNAVEIQSIKRRFKAGLL